MIHNRKARIAARRADAIERARQVLQEVANGSLDASEGYRRVYGIYLGSSGLAEELKPFFRIPGIGPDGFLRVDDEFRAMIRRLADAWLRGGVAPALGVNFGHFPVAPFTAGISWGEGNGSSKDKTFHVESCHRSTA